ncbi:MAG: DUF2849 domain-containing protein [Rhodobacteraceae bacterium]|jgi:hypothetical protein|nr:DUF2849 domain-containing protein [Paracoccaceae bacterium]
MSRAFTPKVLTGNDLRSGEAVYLAPGGAWTPHHGEAELLTDEAEAQLRLLEASAREDRVVGVYLADAQLGRHGPEPVHFREAFRTRGPSNYRHGKQESALS